MQGAEHKQGGPADLRFGKAARTGALCMAGAGLHVGNNDGRCTCGMSFFWRFSVAQAGEAGGLPGF